LDDDEEPEELQDDDEAIEVDWEEGSAEEMAEQVDETCHDRFIHLLEDLEARYGGQSMPQAVNRSETRQNPPPSSYFFEVTVKVFLYID
jgi:hypothetical protein